MKPNTRGTFASRSMMLAALSTAGAAMAQTPGEETGAPAPAAAPASAAASAAATELSAVEVKGMRASLQGARDRKRNADAIVDSIVAEDIGKLPDQNIAEAAQRIPGVQLSRYLEEGAGIAIRGLQQVKTVLNGFEVFGSSAHNGGEYNGRNFDLEDLPTDVLAGIDVAKSSSANEIEGGLGGYVNIRTRKPFDFKGFKASLGAKATDYKMAGGFGSKVKGEVSGLLSNRWSTGVGDMGLLVNLSHGESVFGEYEDNVESQRTVTNFAGSGKSVKMPDSFFTGNGHHGERKRNSGIASFQWQPSQDLQVTADYFHVDYLLQQDFLTARMNPGTPTAAYKLWGDTNSDGTDNLKTGTFDNNSATIVSVSGDEARKTDLITAGAKWNDGGPLRIKAGLAQNKTRVSNTLYEWGTNVNIPSMSLTMNDGSASHVAISGVDLNDKANYQPVYLLAIHQDGNQTNRAVNLDFSYALDGGLFSRLISACAGTSTPATPSASCSSIASTAARAPARWRRSILRCCNKFPPRNRPTSGRIGPTRRRRIVSRAHCVRCTPPQGYR